MGPHHQARRHRRRISARQLLNTRRRLRGGRFSTSKEIILSSPIRSPKDFWSGIMFLLFGLAAVSIAAEYPMGSAGRMGPAYFPVMLGWLLAAIGLVSALRSLVSAGEPLEQWAFKDMFLILGSVILFAALVRGAGLVVAIPVLVLLSSYASRQFRWKVSIALAIGATAVSVLLFVKALGLPLPIVGPWLSA
jgi:hypothetical protein